MAEQAASGMSRRGFSLRAAGVSLLGAAAATGASGSTGCAGEAKAAGVTVENKGGCGDFNEEYLHRRLPGEDA